MIENKTNEGQLKSWKVKIMLKFTERMESGVTGEIYTLENGFELFPNDWNGEAYTVKDNGIERSFKPVEAPISFDEDGEPFQYELIGFEEV